MSNTNNINNINLKDIQTKVDGLHKIDDLDEKLEVIKNVKSELEDYQSKINKFKSEIENEDNYNIDEKFKHMSFQELKNIFENDDLELDLKLKIYQTYSKRLIMLEDELFNVN